MCPVIYTKLILCSKCFYVVLEQRKTRNDEERSFTHPIFCAVFYSHSPFFDPKPHVNACYAGYT